GLSAAALVSVGPDGRPTGVKLAKLSGNTAVDHATVMAAMASTYSAAMKGCKPVAGVYLFHIETGP
ncbi:MAG: energy transducer TonB, partial [Candidatus Eremiobacteraeota bacterium]|nr:energy transducer TonB [Candidatus Eremiobacteraeota bacterium]